jgi:hypothetical protein
MSWPGTPMMRKMISSAMSLVARSTSTRPSSIMPATRAVITSRMISSTSVRRIFPGVNAGAITLRTRRCSAPSNAKSVPDRSAPNPSE